MTILAGLALAIWLYLLLAHGGFWLARETDAAESLPPDRWPNVVAIVPARDEAEVIGRSIASLLAQNYPGVFRVVLVDDGSSDGTAMAARQAGEGTGAAERLEVVSGTTPPRGWTGKLWALETGIRHLDRTPTWLWLTDADIVHAPDTLRALVALGEADGLVLNSLMARLECEGLAERALIPAFVFFFQMLYPFARVNDPRSRVAGAAGGCMLIRADALARAGGIGAIAHAIIDDCAMGRAMKRQGRIRLSLTRRSRSIRPYGGWRAIGAMIARSAYAQLHYSPLLLAGTVAGMALTYLVPPLVALLGQGLARWLALAAWGLMAVAFQPMLRFYHRSPLWGVALPAIASFYGGATILSALHHRQGRGGMWKGRVQAELTP